MFGIAKIWLETALAPVALLGWLLLLGVVAQVWRGLPWRGWAALGVLYFALTLPLTADPAVALLQRRALALQRTCPPPPPGSVLIVLGGGAAAQAAAPDDVGALTQASIRRQLEATRVALQVPRSRMLISGGDGGRWREADLMAALAERLGFPGARITRDTASLTTWQSAVNTARLPADAPGAPRYLLTSAVHMPRAAMAFAHAGQQVCALPLDMAVRDPRPYTRMIPQLTALAAMTGALHEYVGILYYRWVKFR